ncbi:MAG: hypothetical protein ACREQ5_21270 [Candidatus Dormibacteria bacterium]
MSETTSTQRLPIALRTEALEQLLTERGLVDPAAIDNIVQTYETAVGPARRPAPRPRPQPRRSAYCLDLNVPGLASRTASGFWTGIRR